MKRIAMAIALSLTLMACGDAQEKQQHRKPPEEQVISEPAHGLGVLFGKPDPNYTPPGTPVDSPGCKVILPEDRWDKTTLSKQEGKPSEAAAGKNEKGSTE